jgi:mevalonate kinase
MNIHRTFRYGHFLCDHNDKTQVPITINMQMIGACGGGGGGSGIALIFNKKKQQTWTTTRSDY